VGSLNLLQDAVWRKSSVNAHTRINVSKSQQNYIQDLPSDFAPQLDAIDHIDKIKISC